MRLLAGFASNRGLVRQGNEDSFLVRKGLYVVCDGMGGARGGEVASQMACERMASVDPVTAGKDDLRGAIVDANGSIAARSAAEPRLLGMGTTMTSALIRDGFMIIGHVGDSRAYLFHEGELRQITDDHSWVGEMVRRGEITAEEASVHPHRSVITKALGTEGEAEPDILEMNPVPGDRLMLCSDGLSGMVADDTIAQLLRRPGSPQEAADALVEAALQGGGEDNVTVVVVEVLTEVPEGEAGDGAAEGGETGSSDSPGEDEVILGPTDRGEEERSSVPGFMRPALGMGAKLGRRPPIWARQASGAAPTDDTVASPKPGGRPRRRWIVYAAIVVIVLAVAFTAFAVVNSHVYYVGTAEGNVALYKGLPGTVIGIQLSSVVEVSSVTYDSLPQYQRERVDAHDVVGKGEGQAFLRGLASLQ